MTMKLKYVGWVALSGLFAVSLAGCAAQSGQTAPAGSEQAGVQTDETQGPAAGQPRADAAPLDPTGPLEGGSFKIVDTEPGQAADYDIYAVGAPQFASYAVYASPWAEDAAE